MRRLAILLMLLAVAATACGGSDDTTEAVDEAVADAQADAEDAADEVADAVDEAVEDAGAGAGAIDAEACTEAAEALTAVPQSIATALTGQIDVDEVKAQAQLVADLDVPEEFAADFQVIADTYAEVASTLDGIQLEPGAIPDADTQAALTELSTALGDPAYTTASTNVSAYFAGGCQ